jgi:GNAT superfamily N-acetyltransferase
MVFRSYDPSRDREAVRRIWHEVGWLPQGKEDPMFWWLDAGPALVAELNGEAECLIQTAPGSVRYLQEDLPFICISGVSTSRIARKQGFPKRLIAAALADAVGRGAALAGLGIFDQGFYDQLGFGTGGYEHWVAFDPSQLRVSARPRVPRRLGPDDWEMVHQGRLARKRGHGGCNLSAACFTRADMTRQQNGFGLGYCDGANAELTHYFWCHPERLEQGPYNMNWLAFHTREQFLELMALIKSFGDQVHLVRMREPQGIQLQDLLDRPFKHHEVRERSRFESGTEAFAYWQMRICDLPACLAKTHLPGPELRFNLHLTDPIERFLTEQSGWRGAAGQYLVTLGPASVASMGSDPALPTLTATVGAFTRLWLGIRPATGLAVTDHLSGPDSLLQQLDHTLRLPPPAPDWDF